MEATLAMALNFKADLSTGVEMIGVGLAMDSLFVVSPKSDVNGERASDAPTPITLIGDD